MQCIRGIGLTWSIVEGCVACSDVLAWLSTVQAFRILRSMPKLSAMAGFGSALAQATAQVHKLQNILYITLWRERTGIM